MLVMRIVPEEGIAIEDAAAAKNWNEAFPVALVARCVGKSRRLQQRGVMIDGDDRRVRRAAGPR
jgi:hypothetical protein